MSFSSWFPIFASPARLLRLALMALFVALLGGQSSAQAPAPGLSLLASSVEGVLLELHTPGYTLSPSVQAPGFQRVAVPGLDYGETGAPGQPRLPAKTVLVALPPGATPQLQVQVDEIDPQRRVLAIEPVPLEQPQFGPGEGGEEDGLAGQALSSYTGTEHRYELTAAADLAPHQVATLGEIGYLRDQRYVRVHLQPFEWTRAGELALHRRLRVAITFSGGDAAALATPARPDPYFESILARAFINFDQARAWQPGAAAPIHNRPETVASTPPPQRLRLETAAPGIYTVTYADLQNLDVNLTKLNPRTLKLYSRGQELAIYVHGEADGRFDSGDTILFFGEGSTSRYTNTRVYSLLWGGAEGLRMTTRDVNPAQGGAVVTSYWQVDRFEQNEIYDSKIPREGVADRWYWQRYSVGGRNPMPTLSYDVTLSAPVSSVAGQVRVSMRGLVADVFIQPDHRVQFYINDQRVGTGEWNDYDLLERTFAYNGALLRNGVNTFRLTAPGDTGLQTDMGYLNWFQIGYERSLLANDDKLLFGRQSGVPADDGRRLYQIDGFSVADLELYDISDPASPRRLENAGVAVLTGGAMAYTLQFSDEVAGAGRYLAQSRVQRVRPLRIEPDFASNYRSAGNQADYLIISHPDFLTAVQPLALYRIDQGYNVLAIDVQDIYDEFNDGELSPEAIRDFIAYAYHNWQAPAPAYVLLVGDGTFDYLDYKGSSRKNFLPPLLELADPFLRETATDNRFVTISGQDALPDLFIGRFPANSASEVSTMVDKTIRYETAPWPGDWRLRNLFITDNADTAGDFPQLSDQVADTYLFGGYETLKQKIYLGVNYHSTITARADLIQAFNRGAFLTNYTGHGQVTYWASEFIFRAEDALALSNTGRLPVHLSMTCLDGRFHEIANDSISEILARSPSGGAVATWSSTGLGVAHGHDHLHQGFYRALYSDGEQNLGSLIIAGKLNLYLRDTLGVFHDLIDTFGLLGDPALVLGLAGVDLDMALLDAPSAELAQGDPVALRFGISNRSQMPASAVTVEITLPRLDDLAASSTLGPVQITPGSGGGSATRFELGALAAGESAELLITGRIPLRVDSARFAVSAWVSSDREDENPANNTTASIWMQIAAADATIALSKSPAGAQAPGETLALRLGYGNEGQGMATGVAITLPLPAGFTLLNWSAADPGVSQTQAWPLAFGVPDLAEGAGGSIDLTVRAPATLQREAVQAVISTTWIDVDAANDVSDAVWLETAGADAHEPNEMQSIATLLLAPARVEDLSYHQPFDQDWFRFQAVAGVRYLFYTDNLSVDGDTLLLLFDDQGWEIMRNDDAGPGIKWSSLAWVAEKSGNFYLAITRPGGGDGLFLYDLVVLRGYEHYLPTLLRTWQRPVTVSTATPVSTATATATPAATATATPVSTATPTPIPTATATPVVAQCLPEFQTTLSLSGAPRVLTATGNRVLAGIAGIDAVAVFDDLSSDLLGVYSSGGNTPAGMAVWESFYYVSHQGDNRISIFDTASNSLITRFTAGAQPWGLDVAQGGHLYIANRGSNMVSIHNAISGALMRTVAVEGSPSLVRTVGSTAWVTRGSGPTGLVALDVGGQIITPVLGVPIGGEHMTIDSRRSMLYVSHPGQRKIYGVDMSLRWVVQTFDLGFVPGALEINTLNEQLYVISAGGNKLMVLNLRSGALIGQVDIGQQSAGFNGQSLAYLNGHLYVTSDVEQSMLIFNARPCPGLN